MNRKMHIIIWLMDKSEEMWLWRHINHTKKQLDQIPKCFFNLNKNIIIFQINKGHGNLAITELEEVAHVYSYTILKYIGFDTGIFDGVTKIKAATIFGDISRLHKFTKNKVMYVQKTQIMGTLFQYQILTPRNIIQ